jgi:hypothetical protein
MRGLTRGAYHSRMAQRRSAASRLLPFLRAEQDMAEARMEQAVAAVCGRHPGLAEVEVAWFGNRLQGDSGGRYHALGFLADPDQGIEEGRGFVVDVVAGHVMREWPLERRRDLPTHIGALA